MRQVSLSLDLLSIIPWTRIRIILSKTPLTTHIKVYRYSGPTFQLFRKNITVFERIFRLEIFKTFPELARDPVSSIL